MSPKSRWSPPLGASVALKFNKNGLEARKLQSLKVRGVVFWVKNLNGSAHSLFSNPSKKSLNITLEVTR
jgi:hypothetical protein